MKSFLALSLLLLGVLSSFATPISPYSATYIGYQVWSAFPETEAHVQFLIGMDQNEEYDFWSLVRREHDVDLLVPANRLSLLAGQFEQQGLNFKVKIPDVATFIEEQRYENNLLKKDGHMSWDAFHTYDEVVAWLQTLPESYPELATLSVIGRSYEGRDIHVLKLSKNDGIEKPAIFFDATFHAREWITAASLTWAINQFLINPAHDSLLQKADLYFVPFVNPDGYVFSHTTNRFWRKTRNLNNDSTCIGTDPNRNMPHHFGGSGSSSSPCSDTYRGEFALSTDETRTVANFVVGLQANQTVHSYLSIHSAADMWLLPWNYLIGVYPEDFYTHLLPWGQACIQAMFDVHGHEYVTGQGAEVIYEAAGVSQDWAKSIGIQYSATLELRANYGFTPPPSEIIPTAEEMLAGLLVIETTIP